MSFFLTRRRLLDWLLCIVYLGGLTGCSHFSLFHRLAPIAPAATISTAGGASLTQNGAAQTPAAVTSDSTEIEIPISALEPAPLPPARLTPGVASTTTPNAPAPAAVPAPVPVVRIVTHHDNATGPRAFTPPAPSTAHDIAQADMTKWFYVAALLGLLLAGLLAWSAHYLAALKVAAGAIALPVLDHFFNSGVALAVSGVLVAIGLTFFAAWHILNARHNLEPAKLP